MINLIHLYALIATDLNIYLNLKHSSFTDTQLSNTGAPGCAGPKFKSKPCWNTIALPRIQWEEMCKVVHTIWLDWKLRLHQSTTLKQNPEGWWIFFSAQEAIEWGITGRAFYGALTLCQHYLLESCTVNSALDLNKQWNNYIQHWYTDFCTQGWMSAVISLCVCSFLQPLLNLHYWKTKQPNKKIHLFRGLSHHKIRLIILTHNVCWVKVQVHEWKYCDATSIKIVRIKSVKVCRA